MNFHATLCHLKQLFKNIYRMMLASFLFIDEKTTPKISQNDRPYAHPSTKKKDRDKMSAHTISVQSLLASVGE